MSQFSGYDGFFIYPFPWTKEGKDIEKDTRKVASIQELYDFETSQLIKDKK